MFLWKKEKKPVIAVTSVIEDCRKLSCMLWEYYQNPAGTDEFSERSRIFRDSGIKRYTQGSYYTTVENGQYRTLGEVIKSTLGFCIHENFGRIIDTHNNLANIFLTDERDIIFVKVFEEIYEKPRIAFGVIVEMDRKKWNKYYGALKAGDAVVLDGPAKLEYSYSLEGVDALLTNRKYSYEERHQKVFMDFKLKVYM